MKKLICLMSLMFVAVLAWTQPELKVEPQDYDVGIVEKAVVVETNGMTFAVENQYEIVAWQAPAMLERTSEVPTQVVDAIAVPTMDGEISMTLVAFIWPNSNTEIILYADTSTANYNDKHRPGDAYMDSFTSALADVI